MSELETQMEECGVCHALHLMADLVCFDDTLVCPECMEDTTTTCGLHIHVNRTAFGDNIADQEAVIARILYFFDKHWDELLKFSCRTYRQMEQWANRYGYDTFR